VFALCLLRASVATAQTPFFTSVTADVTHSTLTFRGGNFCASPSIVIPSISPTPLTQIGSSTTTLVTVAYPPGAEGMYLFAMQCGANYTYYVLTLNPNVDATLGANTFTGNQTIVGTLHVTSDVTVDGNIGAKYQDVAEWVDAADLLPPGTVVMIDAAAPNRVVATTGAYQTGVAGAVSAKPGIVLGEPGSQKVLVAQSGRVRIKADATFGAIKPGDLLVSSPTPGYAMRSAPVRVGKATMHRPGTIVGKALEELPGGRGEILVLLTLQ
jgi:hypothetical protein